MRSFLPFLFLLLGMMSVLMAQTPPLAFKYQAVCRDVNGNPLINQAVKFKIGIVQGSINGNMVYTEYQLDTTNSYGVSNLEIGRGTPLNGTFSNINWANGPYFINLAFDPAGGNAFVSLGVQELLSVPYALYAGSSNTPGPQGPAGPQGVSITNSWVQGDSLYVALSNSQTLNTGHVRGATGSVGPAGVQGPAGSSGVSVVNTWVQGDSLFVALSNSQTLNAGHVRGATGAAGVQGPVGSNGISIVSSWVQGDSLYVALSNSQTINTGHVRGTAGNQGPAGANGVSVISSWVQGDSLYVALSNSQTLNAGYVRGAIGVQGPAGSNGVGVVSSWVHGDSLFIALSNSQTLNAGHVRGPQGPLSNYSAGTGISIGNNTITNTAPDQVLSLQGSGAASVTGTYPNFNVNCSDTTIWRRSTNSIFYLGRVGIGKANDSGSHVLDVGGRYIQVGRDSAGQSGIVKNIPLNTAGYDGSMIMGFSPNFSTIELHHQLGGYSGGPNASNFFTTFNTTEGGIDSGERMRIAPNGNVGIGTNNPQRDLHINDVMRLEPRNAAPTNPSKGDIYFDNLSNKLRVYDGTTWQNCW